MSKGVCELGPSFRPTGCIFGFSGSRVYVGESGRVFGTRDSAIGAGMGGWNLTALPTPSQGDVRACQGAVGRAANIPACESQR